MSFPLVTFKVKSIVMENGRKKATVALPVNATFGDRDGGLGSHIVLQILTQRTDCTCKASE